jgi:hypothetical protein
MPRNLQFASLGCARTVGAQALHNEQQHSPEHQRMVLRSLRRWSSTMLITENIPIRYRD